jgi:hypothetical protein
MRAPLLPVISLLLLLCGNAGAAGFAVLPFRIPPGMPAECSLFAKMMSDSLAAISHYPSLYLDSSQKSIAPPPDTAVRAPEIVAIGTATGASRVLVGSLSPAGGGPRYSMAIFDAVSGKICFSYGFDRPDSLSPDQFAATVAARIALVCPLPEDVRPEILKRVEAGSLYVRTNPSQAQIYVDSAYAGMSPKVIEDLFPGPHRLFLKHEGERMGQDVTVRPHRMENVIVNFPSAGVNKSDQPSGLTNALRIATLAGACASGGASVYFYNFCKPKNNRDGLVSGCIAGACLVGFILTFVF